MNSLAYASPETTRVGMPRARRGGEQDRELGAIAALLVEGLACGPVVQELDLAGHSCGDRFHQHGHAFVDRHVQWDDAGECGNDRVGALHPRIGLQIAIQFGFARCGFVSALLAADRHDKVVATLLDVLIAGFRQRHRNPIGKSQLVTDLASQRMVGNPVGRWNEQALDLRARLILGGGDGIRCTSRARCRDGYGAKQTNADQLEMPGVACH